MAWLAECTRQRWAPLAITYVVRAVGALEVPWSFQVVRAVGALEVPWSFQVVRAVGALEVPWSFQVVRAVGGAEERRGGRRRSSRPG